jgi:hypothetical protein
MMVLKRNHANAIEAEKMKVKDMDEQVLTLQSQLRQVCLKQLYWW